MPNYTTVINPPDWEQLLSGWLDAPPCQSERWARLKAHYGYESLRLAVLNSDGLPLAMGQLLRRRLPLIRRHWLYCPYGPLWKSDHPVALEQWLTALKEHDFASRAAVLTIEPRLLEEDDAAAEILPSLGFRRGTQDVQPRGSLWLDLTKGEEELFAGLEKRTRYNVGLAERRGVEITLANSEAGVGTFYELLEETMGRQRFLAHDQKYFRRVWEAFGPEQADLLLASYEGEPTAGVFLLYSGRSAYYVYGASTRRHSKHKGAQLLQWRALLRAKERGAEFYDFWGAPVDPQPDHPLYGVYQFKKGFGGRHIALIGAQDLTLSAFGGWSWRVGLPLLRKTRNLLVRGRTADVLD
ncbi:peptidoglycan bridge formation glycyltransferase FemA/FemB family protein [bacterium]|nr:peptidoglycan bridge formation glycyltransferase FemA/FemB family protein [bacterium]